MNKQAHDVPPAAAGFPRLVSIGPGLVGDHVRVIHPRAVDATGLTPAGHQARALAEACLTAVEMLSSNSGYYHDVAHALNVSGVTGELAAGLGRPAARVRFLQQVALFHDFDERIDLNHLDEGPRCGVPARVQVTLAWMDKNQWQLQRRLSWSELEWREARCLIARTDYPFDDAPRQYGTVYDGQSPQGLHGLLLEGLPVSRRGEVLQDGILLSFADQVANYTGTEEQADAAISGLGQEIGVDGAELLKKSAEFHRCIGADIEHDRRVAGHLGVHVELPGREELERWLGDTSRSNLQRNRLFFQRAAQ